MFALRPVFASTFVFVRPVINFTKNGYSQTASPPTTSASSSSSIPPATPPQPLAKKGRLADKVAVVCGAGNLPEEAWGIGSSTAMAFAKEGAKVIPISRTPAKLENLCKHIHAFGGTATPLCADVTHSPDVDAILAEALKQYGRVDILVNSGLYASTYNGFEQLTFDKWKKSIENNLTAQFMLLRSFIPQMKKQKGGTIVLVSTIASGSALGMGKQRLSLAASKAGAETLTKQIAIEFARDNIRANVVKVGYINSPRILHTAAQEGVDPAKVMAERDSWCPTGRQGSPMDVANCVLFLSSEESRYINGTELVVDGGVSLSTFGAK